MSEPGFIDHRALLEVFLAETTERLEEVEEALIRLESHPDDEERLHAIFRAMHTLKGDANTVGLVRLGEIAHLAEDLLEQIRSGARELGAPETALLLRLVDGTRAVLGGVADGRTAAEDPPELGGLLAAFESLVHGSPAAAQTAPQAVYEIAAPMPEEALATLRVPLAKLDRLLDLTGEITVARERLRHLVAAAGIAAGPALTALEEADSLYRELQDLVINARLQPIGPMLRQQLRTLRDVTAACGKTARLVVEDHGVEVDTKVIEHLRAPLAHLVRNAVDHGLETAEARRGAGKDPVGTVTLAARQEAGRVIVSVADDGAGIDREKVTAQAVALGLLPPGTAPDEPRSLDFLFRAGFSTADAVTEISGRGVGLDVVLRGVEALKGTVEIDDRRFAGTTVSIRVPLRVAILDGFVVGVGGAAYVLPLEIVLGCRDLAAPERAAAAAHGMLDVDGRALPFLRLRHGFAAPAPAGRRESVVVVRWGEERAGLVVDDLFGSTQAVVKPLPPGLAVRPGFSGTAVLGDGRVAMILDVPALLSRLLSEGSRPAMTYGQRPRSDRHGSQQGAF